MPRRCLHGVHPLTQPCERSYVSFASALPARGASQMACIRVRSNHLCLGAACTGCITGKPCLCLLPWTLPRRCLHGVHLRWYRRGRTAPTLCLGAACTGCIPSVSSGQFEQVSLPRRCLHGVHPCRTLAITWIAPLPRRCLHGVHHQDWLAMGGGGDFASALPARGASTLETNAAA